MSNIKELHGKPRLHVSVNLLFGVWLPCCRTPLSSSPSYVHAHKQYRYEIQIPHDKNHKVSSLVKSHQNTVSDKLQRTAYDKRCQYLCYTALTSPKKGETAVRCCDPTLPIHVMLVSRNVFHVVSALQFILSLHIFILADQISCRSYAVFCSLSLIYEFPDLRSL